MTSHNLINTLHIECGCFNQCVVDLTIHSVIIAYYASTLLYNCVSTNSLFLYVTEIYSLTTNLFCCKSQGQAKPLAQGAWPSRSCNLFALIR